MRTLSLLTCLPCASICIRERHIKPLNEWTATEIVAGIDAGTTTCEAVTRACLDRIAERERDVQAWAYVNADQAIEALGHDVWQIVEASFPEVSGA